MKIAITSNGAFIDQRDGSLVEGRLSVYLRDSDDLATTYTLEGNDFVQAENPVLLHSGLPNDTLFADAGIYRLKVEKYTGPEGQMSVDADPAYFEQVDIYEVGFDWDSAVTNAQNVDSIDDLRSVDPSVGSVNVLSYYSIGDAPSRTYVWDGASVDQIDGGYVVGSDVSDTGRWILLWGDEILPCTVYGVSAGHEANLNSLFQYPRLVGSFSFVTAPCIRFTRGNYTTAVNLTTDKELVFDGDAKFTLATIQCPRVRVIGSRSSYVGDFALTAPDAEAHSSWFRTLNAFWHCGAKYLYIDSTNYFESSVVTANVDLTGKVVVGSTRIEATYAANKYIRLGVNTVVTGRIFNPATDYVKIGNGLGDRMFLVTGNWDPGLITDGHHVEYEYVPDLDLFENEDRWLKTMVERRARLNSTLWPDYAIDFHSRTTSSSADIGTFTKVCNLVAKGGIVVHSDCTLNNVEGVVTVNADSCALILKDSVVTIDQNSLGLTGLQSEDSDIVVPGTAGIDPADTSVMVRGGQFSGYIKLSDAHANTYAMNKTVSFTGVHFPTHFKWRINVVALFRCTGSVSLDILPYANGSDYSYSCNFTENVFNGASMLSFTMFGNETYQHQEIAGKVNFNGVRIVGNSFNGSDPYGIYLMRWHPYSLAPFMSSSTGTYEYHGNSGACPRPTPGSIDNVGEWTGEHTAGTLKWRVSEHTYNVFAPYASSNDGSVGECRDVSGLVSAPSATSIAYIVAGFGDTSGMNVVATGFSNGSQLPSDLSELWNPQKNNLFIVKACITVGLPAVPSYNSGYTIWYNLNAI
jgi:hypothetical protein